MRNKSGSIWSLLFSIVFLVAVIFVTSYYAYDFYLMNQEASVFVEEVEDEGPITDINIVDSYPNGILFYPKMRFISPDITYSIDVNCDSDKIEDAREAFSVLTNETVLRFRRVIDGQISVTCSEDEIFTDSEHFIAGEGGPTYLINNGKYVVIYNGTIQLYKKNTCRSPLVAIHEILHVIGFTHSLNKSSIMYNYSSCNQKITGEIIDKIGEMYADPILPDLKLSNLSASRSGRYLDFEVSVLNVGLADAKDVELVVYDEDRDEIERYDLDDIRIGQGNILKLTNLRVSSSLARVIFVVDSDNLIKEIDEDNNEKVLGIALS